ncbi:hypothetical protein RCZ04_17520 [Capnocytophaga sp. HP1101]
MKPYYLIISLLLLLTGCRKEDYMELFKEGKPFEIKAQKQHVALDAANPEQEAIKFTWTAGSNYGTNAGITYTFQMDIQGNNFAGGISENVGREVYERSYKNEELNNLLLNTFNVAVGTEVTMEVRTIAQVSSGEGMKQHTNVQTVVFKTHEPISNTLYIIGSAAPNGWSADNAEEMKAVDGSPKTFSWSGRLAAGELKFITTKGKFVPSYGKGSNNSELHYRKTDADTSDDKFTIDKGGVYTIKVNLINLSVSIEKGEAPEYTELWFVGEPTGWSFKKMTVDPLDPFVFHYNADLGNGGEFKIGTKEGDWSAVFFRPETANTPEGTDLPVKKWAGDPDNKWKISAGTYKITLNTRTMKIDIVPFTPYTAMYMIGSATDAGWDIGNPVVMTADNANPNIFTWEGDLKAGELKFSCDKKSDWGGAWFLASEGDKAPAGEKEPMLFSPRGSEPDNKWKITDVGTYKITLNQLTQTVIIKKQ